MHFSAELISTYKIKKRKPLPVINLSSNLSSLTAWSNDFNFNTYLARELEALSSKDDLLILYSTSGGNIKKKQSLNLINVAKFCKKKKIKIIAFLGNKGGELIKYADISYVVNSNNTPVIQETHHLINHLISEILDTNYS